MKDRIFSFLLCTMVLFVEHAEAGAPREIDSAACGAAVTALKKFRAHDVGARCFQVAMVTVELGAGLDSSQLDFTKSLQGRRPLKGELATPVRVRLQDNAVPTLSDAKRYNRFAIDIDPDGITVHAADARAALYALDALGALLDAADGLLVPGRVEDWADLEIRAMQFVMRKTSLIEAKRVVEMARVARFNTLILSLADAVDIDRRIVEPRKGALSVAEFKELVAYVRRSGMEFIPSLALLTHQGAFMRRARPDLLLNRATYDPRKAEVYELVFSYLDQLIALIQPRIIHIGHDEVQGLHPASRRKWLEDGEEALPPELYLEDIEKLNQYLRSKGIKAWMWGDMLITQSDFSEMGKQDFNGIAGYEKLISKIPKDIVITDWHYHHEGPRFPTVDAFIAEGHQVLGATYKNSKNIEAFATYMADRQPGGIGMIATIWRYVQKKQWAEVESLISYSGVAYWRVGHR